MALTDEVLMPGADYQAICNAVRGLTGGTSLLKSGDIATAIGGVKKLTVKSGTITFAEATKSVTIPCGADAQTVVLKLLGGKPETIPHAMAFAAVCNRVTVYDGQLAAIGLAWTSTGVVGKFSTPPVNWSEDNVSCTIQGSSTFAAAEYEWTAYCWEEETE